MCRPAAKCIYEGSKLGTAIDLDEYRAQRCRVYLSGLSPAADVERARECPGADAGVGESNASSRVNKSAALLTEMGLENRLRQFPSQLSAGERQRVAIARALANNPAILVADEPTGNLDSVNSGRIMEILTGIQREHGMTLIVVTHENEIAEMAPRHIRIRDGKVEK